MNAYLHNLLTGLFCRINNVICSVYVDKEQRRSRNRPQGYNQQTVLKRRSKMGDCNSGCEREKGSLVSGGNSNTKMKANTSKMYKKEVSTQEQPAQHSNKGGKLYTKKAY